MSESQDSIAIIGTSGRFPGAGDVEQFWKNLADAKETITRFSSAELIASGVDHELIASHHYVPARPCLEQADWFDAEFFGYSSREAEQIDPQQRLFLEVCWEALEQAGIDPAATRSWIGVFAGASLNTYLLHELGATRERFDDLDGIDLLVASEKDYLSTRVAYKLNLRGPAVTVQTACSSSLVAIHQACQALILGHCDLALAGGASVEFPQRAGYRYLPNGVRSPDGRCRAFDAHANGTVFGDAVGVVLLKRLDEALRDGDPIQAVILGTAINNDGSNKVGYTAPSIEGQARVIALAQAAAGVEADSIGYVEAHGTGTPMGDPIEVRALTKAFRRGTERVQFCGLGSVKSNIGHTNSAAGVSGIIKVVESLKHRQIPATLHVRTPTPEAELDSSPFFLNLALAPFPVHGSRPRRAALNSFGIGGTNAHAILEEAPPSPVRDRARDAEYILPLSARTASAVAAQAARLAGHLRDHSELRLDDVAHTLQRGRRAFGQRSSVVARSVAEAVERLDAVTPTTTRRAAERARVVFMFTGQGTQFPGMGRDLYAAEAVFRDSVDRCAELLIPALAGDLRDLLLWSSDGRLDYAEAQRALTTRGWMQPSLFVVQYALAELLQSRGVRPAALLGHSLGEVAAACVAGVFTLEQALALAVERDRAMRSQGGAMLSVPLDAAEVVAELGSGLALASINYPGSCVVSGSDEAVLAYATTLERRGISVKRLPLSVAGHSPLMRPAAERLRALVGQFALSPPTLPVLSGMTADYIEGPRIASADYWAEELLSPVRFSDAVRRLGDSDETVFVEIGPGRTLCTSVELHGASWLGLAVQTLPGPKDADPAERTFAAALAALWERGAPIDWQRSGSPEGRRVALPTYPFERKRHSVDSRATRAAARVEDRPLERWFSVPTLRRVSRPFAAALRFRAGEGWVVVRDRGSALGNTLESELRNHGQRVFGADAGADWSAAFGGLSRDGFEVDHILDCSAFGEVDPPASAGCATAVPHALSRFFQLGRALSELPTRRRTLHVIASDVFSGVDGQPPNSVRAALAGACRSLAYEIPGLTTRLIDVRDLAGEAGSSASIRQLCYELSDPDPPPSLLLCSRGSFELALEELKLESPPGLGRLEHRGVYVITGGLRGIGRELARHLALRLAARLVLIGRPASSGSGAAPGTDTNADARFVEELEQLGAEVCVLKVDISDRTALGRALDSALLRFGRIDGALHAAGVAGHGILSRKSDADIAAVLAPKIAGTENLHALLSLHGAKFLVLFSSTLGFLGGPGQVDYAAANRYLAGFCEAERQSSVEVITLHWDVWEGVGMAARLGLVRRAPPEAGAPCAAGGLHPLLDEHEAIDNGEHHFVKRLRPDEWILAEHRLNGTGTVPGTAFIAAARAVHCAITQTSCVQQVRAFSFIAPCQVSDTEFADLLVEARPERDGHRLSFVRRAGAGAPRQPLAECHISEADPGALRIDLAAIRGRGVAVSASRLFEAVNQSSTVAWGPRWDCLRELYLDGHEALGRLELDERFAAECPDFGAHPALLDVATALAATLGEEAIYLPAYYERLVFHGPLPRNVWSYVRLQDGTRAGGDLVADVTLSDASGRVLIEIDRFRLTRHSGRRPQSELRGIDPQRGMEAVERILAHSGFSQLFVSPRDLTAQLRGRSSRPPFGAAALGAAPAQSGASESPSSADLVARIWAAVLGLESVDSSATFFELGGHSLLALQLQAKLVQALDVQISLQEFFKNPTLHGLSLLVDAARTGAAAPELTRGSLPQVADASEYPLSPAQRRLFFLQQLEPASTKYNNPIAVRVRGELAAERLTNAIQTLVDRHESLRTSYHLSGDVPVQRIQQRVSVELEQRRVTAAEIEHPLRATLQPFDLSRAPLLRACALWLGPADVVLLCDIHHIAADGLSMAVIGRELLSLLQGSALPQPGVRFRDYVRWLEQRSSSGAHEVQRRYWLERFKGELPALELPCDFPKPEAATHAAASHQFEFDGAQTSAVRRLALDFQVTPYMVLLGLFATLLHRLSGHTDVVVGTPTAGRRHAAVEGVVGMFVNTLPIRLEPRPEQRFSDWLSTVRESTLRAFDNQDYPFEELIQQLEVRRDAQQNPLFDVFFTFQDGELQRSIPRVADRGLSFTPLPVAAAEAKFLLSLRVLDLGATMACDFEYRRELFAAGTIHRFAECLMMLLRGVLSDPDAKLGEIEIVPEHERRLILDELNHTDAPFPSGTVLEQFWAQCGATPSAVAVSDAHARYSYAELRARSGALAAHLRRRGVRSGQIVAVLLERSVDLAVALFGILQAGAAYLPLDVRNPAARLRFLVEDSGAVAVVADNSTRERARPIIGAERVVALDAVGNEASAVDAAPPHANDLAYVIYTSGSTGKPKGVLIEHGALLNRLHWMQKQYPIGQDDVVLQKTAYTFDVSVWELFWWALTGASVHFLPPGDERDPTAILRVIAERRITVLHFVPSMLDAFLHTLEQGVGTYDLGNLKFVFSSGEALGQQHALRWNRLAEAANARLVNLYGPTEATIDVSYYEVPRDGVPRNVPIGRPIDNTSLYIVNEAGRLQPIGVPGELWIGGVGLARGYLNRPELDERSFVPNAFRPGTRAYRTGDRARYLPDGDIEYLGRFDHQLKVRGFRIEAGEIESRLREIPGVHAACVLLGGPDPTRPLLCAYYVAGPAVREEAVRHTLLQALPDYMVPSFLCRMDALPLTSSGKLDRGALPSPVAGGSPDTPAPGAEAPTTELEEVLLAAWRSVLANATIGATDDFFRVGGDSIKAILVVSRLRQQGLRIEIADLFTHSTVRALAARFPPAPAQEVTEAAAALPSLDYRPFALLAPEDRAALHDRTPVLELEDAYPLPASLQHVLAQNLAALDRAVTVHRYSFLLEGNLDVDAFRAAWREVLRRHPVLRSSFVWRRVSVPLQVIHTDIPLPLEIVDWSELEDASRAAAERAVVEGETLRGFRAQEAPLFRLVLARLSRERSKLWMFIQNSLFDAWSAGILNRDLQLAYAAERSANGPKPDAAQASSFGAFVAWLRQRDPAPAHEFYSRHLRGAVLSAAAFSAPRAFDAAERELSLSTAATGRVTLFAQRLKLPLNVLVHAAWAGSIAEALGRDDIVMGTVTSGRPVSLPNIESLMGLLANVLPVRVRVARDTPLRDWLRELSRTLLDVREHEHVDLHRIADAAGIDVSALQQVLHTRTLVFLNAPERTPSESPEPLQFKLQRADAHLEVPLRVYVSPGPRLHWKVRYDAATVTAQHAETTLRRAAELLEALPTAESRVADWLTAPTTRFEEHRA